MVFFKKKKEEKKIEEPISLPTIEELKKIVGKEQEEAKPKEILAIPKEIPEEIPKEIPKEEIEKLPAPPVPVFVKLEKYNEILDLLSSSKKAIETLVNSISLLEEIEEVRKETIRTIKSISTVVQERISDLEGYFLKPALKPKVEKKLKEIEGLETLIKDLKSQIQTLKSRLA